MCHSDVTGDFAKSSHDIRNYGQLAYWLEFVEQFSFQSWHRVIARQGNAWVISRRPLALLEAWLCCYVRCYVMIAGGPMSMEVYPVDAIASDTTLSGRVVWVDSIGYWSALATTPRQMSRQISAFH